MYVATTKDEGNAADACLPVERGVFQQPVEMRPMALVIIPGPSKPMIQAIFRVFSFMDTKYYGVILEPNLELWLKSWGYHNLHREL